MSAPGIVGQWTLCLRRDYLPTCHGHQVNAVASLSYAMALARHCSSGQVCLHAPGEAKPASVRRRQERLMANERLDPHQVARELSLHLLEHCPSRQVILILDETPKGNLLRAMELSLAWKARAVPLLEVCYRPTQPPCSLNKLVVQMIHQIASLMPASKEVTLLADRGLCWPVVVRACERLGWHWVIRAQSQTRFRDERGREHCLADLVGRPGQQYFGSGHVLKKARWQKSNVVAVWEKGRQERWLLISDQPASYQRCRSYLRRTWCEETHRDQKSSGFQWQQSRVDDPERAQRLRLLMALAMLLSIALGCQVLKRGWRRALDPHHQRRLSVFQLGLRWLTWCVHHQHALGCAVARLPPRS